MSSFAYNQLNPPPPPPANSISINVASAEISTLVASTPSHAHIMGLPIQYVTISSFLNFSLITQEEISIDFSLEPFTYLNFSNVTTDPSPKITVRLKHVPIGTFFIVNGPVSWETSKGQLILEDTDSSGNPLPNAILEIEPRGTPETPTNYTNFLVGRDESGFVARAMT